MKVLSLILLIAVSVQPSLASRRTQLQDPPDIVILKWSWKVYSSLPGNISSTASQDSVTNPKSREPFGPKDQLESARQGERVKAAPPPGNNRPVKRYQYRVVVKNTGGKTIKSLTWNYLFIYPGNEERFERHQFHSEKKIKPGQKQELTQLSLKPPVLNVSALSKTDGKHAGERVVITRIEYSDGSVWNLGSN